MDKNENYLVIQQTFDYERKGTGGLDWNWTHLDRILITNLEGEVVCGMLIDYFETVA